MPSVILAGTTTGTSLSLTGDTSGELQIQTNNGSTTAMTLTTAGNVGVGVAPSPWSGVGSALQIGLSAAIIGNSASSSSFISNAYFDGTNYRYINTGTASRLAMTSANYVFTSAGSGTAGNVVTFAESMRIDSSGNVGIGASSPVYQTQIYGSGQTTAALTDAGNKGGSLLLNTPTVSAGDGGALLIGAGGSGAKPFSAIKGLLADGGGNTTGSLAFSTRNATGDTALTERMRIDASGRLLQGTMSSTAFVGVVTNANWATVFSASNSSTSFDSSIGNVAIDNPDTTANNYSRLAFTTNDGANRVVSAGLYAQITARSTANWTTSNLQFYTGAIGGPPTEKMRIDSVGRLTTPFQPGFNAHVGPATQTSGVIVWSTTRFNTGSNYNTSNGTFTAPVAGVYMFAWQVYKNNSTSASTSIFFERNGAALYEGLMSGVIDYISIEGSIIVNMAANDTARLTVRQGVIHTNNSYSYFSGMLIG